MGKGESKMTFKYTIGTIIIIYALMIASFILIDDLNLVLNSYGTWSIFLEKLVMSFVTMVALIAFIKGKIGLDTSWINKEKIGTDYGVYKFILLNIVLSIILLSIVSGLNSNKTETLETYLATWIGLSIFCVVIWTFGGTTIMNSTLGKKKDNKTIQTNKSSNELVDAKPLKKEVINSLVEPIPYPVNIGFFVYKNFRERMGYEDIKALMLSTYNINFSTESYLDILDKFKYPTSHKLYFITIPKDEFFAMQYVLGVPYDVAALYVRSIYNKKLLKYKYLEYGKKIQTRMENGKSFEEAIKMKNKRKYSEYIFWITFFIILTILLMQFK